MTASTSGSLVADSERIFGWLAAEQWHRVRELMTPATAEVLTVDVLRDTWLAALREQGVLIECRGTQVEMPDGTPINADEAVLGDRVVVTTLVCEAGDWLGRVAWTEVQKNGRTNGQAVAGLLIVPPNSGPWPF